MPQSQTAALPRHQEEEESDKTKRAQIKKKKKKKKRTKSTKISSLFPKPGNRKGLKNTRTKLHKVRHKTIRLVE